jgi:hypothetical protein
VAALTKNSWAERVVQHLVWRIILLVIRAGLALDKKYRPYDDVQRYIIFQGGNSSSPRSSTTNRWEAVGVNSNVSHSCAARDRRHEEKARVDDTNRWKFAHILGICLAVLRGCFRFGTLNL